MMMMMITMKRMAPSSYTDHDHHHRIILASCSIDCGFNASSTIGICIHPLHLYPTPSSSTWLMRHHAARHAAARLVVTVRGGADNWFGLEVHVDLENGRHARDSYHCSAVCILLWSDAPGAAPPPHTTCHWQPQGGFTTAIAGEPTTVHRNKPIIQLAAYSPFSRPLVLETSRQKPST